MSAEKIQLRTGAVKLPGNKRKPDEKHATDIVDHARRGYIVSAADPDTWWSCSFMYNKGLGLLPVFVNQPEGTIDALILRPYKGTEDARLYDEPYPQWMTDLMRLIATVAPTTLYLSGFGDYQQGKAYVQPDSQAE